MSVKLRLVINNRFGKKEKFFVKKELRVILDLYAKKVSAGDWKDYGLTINKKQITIFIKGHQKNLFIELQNLNPKHLINRFYILDRNESFKKIREYSSLISSVGGLI